MILQQCWGQEAERPGTGTEIGFTYRTSWWVYLFKFWQMCLLFSSWPRFPNLIILCRWLLSSSTKAIQGNEVPCPRGAWQSLLGKLWVAVSLSPPIFSQLVRGSKPTTFQLQVCVFLFHQVLWWEPQTEHPLEIILFFFLSPLNNRPCTFTAQVSPHSLLGISSLALR